MSFVILQESGEDSVDVYGLLPSKTTEEEAKDIIRTLNNNPFRDGLYSYHQTKNLIKPESKRYRALMWKDSGELKVCYPYYPGLDSFYAESYLMNGLLHHDGDTEKEAIANCKHRFDNWDYFKTQDSVAAIMKIPGPIKDDLLYRPHTNPSLFWERVTTDSKDFVINHKFTGKVYLIKRVGYDKWEPEEVDLVTQKVQVISYKKKGS